MFGPSSQSSLLGSSCSSNGLVSPPAAQSSAAQSMWAGEDVAAAHCDRWPKVVEVINESLDGEYGEQVAAVEWSD